MSADVFTPKQNLRKHSTVHQFFLSSDFSETWKKSWLFFAFFLVLSSLSCRKPCPIWTKVLQNIGQQELNRKRGTGRFSKACKDRKTNQRRFHLIPKAGWDMKKWPLSNQRNAGNPPYYFLKTGSFYEVTLDDAMIDFLLRASESPSSSLRPFRALVLLLFLVFDGVRWRRLLGLHKTRNPRNTV